MLIDLTMMKRPKYVTLDERSWRASIRQPTQPDPANFFGDLMNEYEKVRVLCCYIRRLMIISYNIIIKNRL